MQVFVGHTNHFPQKSETIIQVLNSLLEFKRDIDCLGQHLLAQFASVTGNSEGKVNFDGMGGRVIAYLKRSCRGTGIYGDTFTGSSDGQCSFYIWIVAMLFKDLRVDAKNDFIGIGSKVGRFKLTGRICRVNEHLVARNFKDG
jgi:hypothetical protein